MTIVFFFLFLGGDERVSSRIPGRIPEVSEIWNVHAVDVSGKPLVDGGSVLPYPVISIVEIQSIIQRW
jgi:hypothetical protein